jgi:integrase
MTWAEVDLATATWVVPPRRMKTGREHRVALSSEAMAVLKMMAKRRIDGAALVFPGYKQGRPLTVPTLSKALHIANGGNGFTLHGTSRSGLDDYISEKTDFSQKLIDRALSHQPKSGKTVRAYRRADLLEPRRPMMDAWGRHLSGH